MDTDRPALRPINLNLAADQIEWLQRRASAEQRSVSQVARLVLAERMDRDDEPVAA